MSGTPQALFVLVLWLPITLSLFIFFPPRKAVIMSFIGGLLFLPQDAGFKLPLIPNYQGMVATCYGIILGIIIYDLKSIRKFRGKWLDVPMLIWCICPIFSSLANDLGLYDGINQAITQTTIWGLPYFLGRIYLNNLSALKELAISIVKGGLIYVPLCLFESRMSPQLHRIFYGYHPHLFFQTYRLGGYRPTVFMQHGLMVGMWMMLATLVAFWLWQSKAINQVWGLPIRWIVIILLFTFILVRSTGAYFYFLYGLIILFSAKWFRSNLPLILLILGIFYYLYLGVSGSFKGEALVNWLAEFNPDRAQSLEFRLENEEILGEKARERMIFGWGGWGRNRVYEENWQGELVDISVTDSLWIIVFGDRGIVGLISLTAALLFPVLRFSWRGYPPKTWFIPQIAATAVLSVGLSLFMLDCLLNAMFNPVFPLISGGLSGLTLLKLPQKQQKLQPQVKLRRLALRAREQTKDNSKEGKII